MNVDHRETRPAAARYGVRATPTFIVLNAEGKVVANVPGWPGFDNFVQAFNQMLAEG